MQIIAMMSFLSEMAGGPQRAADRDAHRWDAAPR